MSMSSVSCGSLLVLIASCDTTPKNVDIDATTPIDAASELADANPRSDAPTATPTASFSVVTDRHRYAPGAMFGGWGSHLGHLVRLDNSLFWVDDACTQSTPGDCDASFNRRLEYRELVEDAWILRRALVLPAGIQQNTGTIVDGNTLASFGVDIATRQIIECRMQPGTWSGSCAPITSGVLPASSNYVGAAISPEGYPLVWATTVVDGGGGSFHWFVNYGAGWNGPRTGPIGGFNDASYINIAFGDDATDFVMHAQMVSGIAPNWSFIAAMADGDATSLDPMTFTTMPAAEGDALMSTNDVIIDPQTGDTHVLARTLAGKVAYAHRPEGGVWSEPTIWFGPTLRARWVLLANQTLLLVHGRGAEGLVVHSFPPEVRTAGEPLEVGSAPEFIVDLPDGYDQLFAIYPEVAVYQQVPPGSLNVVLVGADRQNEVLHVTVDGL